jgi:hypothetical protein
MGPTRDQHLKQAAENEKLARLIREGPPEHYGWAVTALFYSAVQYGRAYLSSKDILITSHQQFATHLLRTTGNEELYGHYRRLKDESERARYDCATFSLADIDDLEREHFAPFREAMDLAMS